MSLRRRQDWYQGRHEGWVSPIRRSDFCQGQVSVRRRKRDCCQLWEWVSPKKWNCCQLWDVTKEDEARLLPVTRDGIIEEEVRIWSVQFKPQPVVILPQVWSQVRLRDNLYPIPFFPSIEHHALPPLFEPASSIVSFSLSSYAWPVFLWQSHWHRKSRHHTKLSGYDSCGVQRKAEENDIVFFGEADCLWVVMWTILLQHQQ